MRCILVSLFALAVVAPGSGQYLAKDDYAKKVNFTDCSASSDGATAYDYSYVDLNSTANVSLSQHRQKVILVVNVATFCGYTYQYLKLNPLRNHFNGSLEILAFPCNQFWLQEPGVGPTEIYNGIKYIRPGAGYVPNFPLAEKTDVNGPKEHPLYNFLKRSCPATRSTFSRKEILEYNEFNGRDIRWNFEKFLIEPVTGKPYRRYDPDVQPNEMMADIQLLLNNKRR